MSIPSKQRINLVLPDPSWRKALKHLAEQRGISLSQYICQQLQLAVNRELAAMRENGQSS